MIDMNGGNMIVGITGGIGSGKSTVTKIFHKFGYSIVDADKIARNMLEYGTETYHEAVNCFGQGILYEDGRINRSKLAEIVFNDSEKLAKLNRITHKAVREIALKEIEDLKEKGLHRIAYDCPLPVEKGFLDIVDIVVTVWAPLNKRLDLIKARNPNMSEERIRSVMKNQMSDDEYFRIADYIIENTETLEDLSRKTEAIIKKIEGSEEIFRENP
jgi:dephospho-CoA kinase